VKRKYIIERTSKGVQAVVQRSDEDFDYHELADVCGFGFEMGYDGAGPKNLAASIIADAVVGEFASLYVDEVVSKMPNSYRDEKTVSVVSQREVLAWLRDKLSEEL
jgi:hypothetical protein